MTGKVKTGPGAMTSEAADEVGEKLGDTIRRVLYIIVTFGLVCFVTLLSPDETIVPANGALIFPYVQATVNVTGFMVFGPFVLISLSIYLHVLYQRFLLLRGTAPDVYVFSMRGAGARIVTGFLFYWLVPIILCLFFWSMLPRPGAGNLAVVAAASLAGFGALHIFRLISGRHRLAVIGAVGLLIATVGALSVWAISDTGRSTLLKWRGVDFSRASFEDKDMAGVDLRGAAIEDAVLTNSTLRRANLSRSSLPRAKLENTDLRESNLSNVEAPELRLKNVKMQAAILRGAFLQGAVMEQVDARSANLEDATLTGAVLNAVDLSFARLEDATLSDVTFENVDLTSAKMSGATLLKAIMRRANFYYAVLNKVRALKADFLAANLLNASLQGADLQKADFTSADLRGAKLTDALLNGADLRLAKLDGTDLTGADLENADLRGATGLDCDVLMTAKNWSLSLRDDKCASQPS